MIFHYYYYMSNTYRKASFSGDDHSIYDEHNNSLTNQDVQFSHSQMFAKLPKPTTQWICSYFFLSNVHPQCKRWIREARTIMEIIYRAASKAVSRGYI